MLIFTAITLFYLFTRWLIFKGFNGTDDLHYAMLSAKMIRGNYDPFQPGDIFSGRILLIATQALFYKLAGINIITTQALSLMVLILSCYLTVFKLLPAKSTGYTLIASFLFYFNPVITYMTVGLTGDIYVMLSGILLCLMLKSWILNIKSLKKTLLTGIITAFIISLSLLYKETILVFIPFVCIAALIYDRLHAKQLILSLLATFIICILLYGLLYNHYTGNTFFKVSQINNSSYLQNCSYNLLPFKYLLIRLTYGVWKDFIIQGFYPVIFGAFISVIIMYRKHRQLSTQHIFAVLFSILMTVCLYFPFSLKGYSPLCSDPRQFMMLLPTGVIVTASFISETLVLKVNRSILFFISSGILLICIFGTGNKWQWMIYSLICIYTFLLLGFTQLSPLLKTLALSFILWLSILENLFFKNSNWFHDMIKLDKQLSSKYYYFPDHDNMMHWQLLHQFDIKTFSFYNLEKNPFKIFKIYYQYPDTVTFHAGWLIINKSYTVRSTGFLNRIDSLQQEGYFTNSITAGDVKAVLIDVPAKLSYLGTLIQADDN